jgi:hypothetical protein
MLNAKHVFGNIRFWEYLITVCGFFLFQSAVLLHFHLAMSGMGMFLLFLLLLLLLLLLIIIIIIIMALHPLLGLGGFFSFLILYTVGRTPRTGDQPTARPLTTHRTTRTQNKRTQTSMSRVESGPTTPVFEWTKTAYVLDRAATVIGGMFINWVNFDVTFCGLSYKVWVYLFE